eukprot:gb/GECG01003962.1/.p1 GENE.gb/GECG01003962.1/~~gb/GECG01003962.1/.p1  ORF type:complete len:102 (+),score=6.10 gb/GECG01003962.1/:1-306(+)
MSATSPKECLVNRRSGADIANSRGEKTSQEQFKRLEGFGASNKSLVRVWILQICFHGASYHDKKIHLYMIGCGTEPRTRSIPTELQGALFGLHHFEKNYLR